MPGRATHAPDVLGLVSVITLFDDVVGIRAGIGCMSRAGIGCHEIIVVDALLEQLDRVPAIDARPRLQDCYLPPLAR